MNVNDSSTVSVVTPAYNSARNLYSVIDCVLQQDMSICEHIVIDDGSTDQTAELMNHQVSKYSHLVYIRQKQSGVASARNLGIEAATGRYIAFLDSDDLWLNGKLESQVGFMQREQVAFSYGDYAIHRRVDDHRITEFSSPHVVTYRDLLRGCPIGCLTAAYDQEALGKVYMPLVRRGQDWGLWLALARLGGPARKYPGMHAVYRYGGESLSANKVAKLLDVYSIYRHQEGLGRAVASVYLARHAVSALVKRP